MTKEVLNESDGKRRVEEAKEVAFYTSRDVVMIETGDHVHRAMPGGEEVDEVLAIGDDLSPCDGLHAKLTDPRDGTKIVHLRLIQRWLDRDDCWVTGERTNRHTEVEGVDY